jgi:hypothetical protein
MIRKVFIIAALVLLSWGAPQASAQYYEEDEAFVDAFAPADVDNYGGPAPANQGYFATIQGVAYQINAPALAVIGYPELTAIVADADGFRPQTSTQDTSPYKADYLLGGNLIDFGRVQDQWGWLCSITIAKPNTQVIDSRSVDVAFLDPGFNFVREIIQVNPFAPNPGGGGFGFFYQPYNENVGYLDGFVNRSRLDTVDDDLGDDFKASIFVADNPNAPPDQIFVVLPRLGRFYDGNLDGVVNPDDIADNLDPSQYDLADLARIPVTFDRLIAKNETAFRSIEFMPFFRFRPTRRNGNFELAVGARYSQFNEYFSVLGRGGVLDESFWDTRAYNHMVGPQIGMRYAQRTNRWTLSAEGRFFSAFNFQNIRQTGTIGSRLGPVMPAPSTNRPVNTPAYLATTHIDSVLHINEWSPTTEVRLNASFQLTRSLSFVCGWNAQFMNAIARPSNMINYTMPALGINSEKNRQDVFMNGMSFGIELNR